MAISKFITVIVFLISGILIFSCSSTKKNNMKGKTGISSPPAIVYKTRKDYYKNIPVMLSADKQKIVSYPAPTDIRRGADFTYPTKLHSGYLLDNRGIGINTAFLRFTYEDYYNMDNIPTADRLMEYIIDDNPFLELYQLGNRGEYTDIEQEINKIIDENKMKKFTNLAK